MTKAVILAGGRGTRLAEETTARPKPLVDVGGKPILWHIMKIYGTYGINDFIVCAGYLGSMIKEYFNNYYMNGGDVTFDLRRGRVEILNPRSEPWRVTVVDTGLDTQTGGRLARIRCLVEREEWFHVTYGDGVASINIEELTRFHLDHGKLATITAVVPEARFGALKLDGSIVREFREKPSEEAGRINGGFFVLSPRALDVVSGDDTIWEREPMARLAREDQLRAFSHNGFWQPMDVLRDRLLLEELWRSGTAPWKVWV